MSKEVQNKNNEKLVGQRANTGGSSFGMKADLSTYSVVTEAQKIVNAVWVPSEFDEEAGLKRGVNKVVELNPELSPAKERTLTNGEVLLRDGVLSELSVDTETVEKIERDEKRRYYSM